MTARTVEIQLTSSQHDFCHSPSLYRALVGGRGGGKTYAGSYDILRRARSGELYGVYAPTFRMLQDSTLRTFMEVGRKLRFISDWKRGDMIATLGNGAEILFRSLDDPEKARGPNLSGAWMDEASLVPKEAFDIIIASLRAQGRMGWLSATFTPKGKSHWTYDTFGRGGANVGLFRAPTRDNPFLAEEFVEAVSGQYTSHLASQELSGEFIDPEGSIAKREWFPIVDVAPDSEMKVRFWDLAATKDMGDYTVGSRMSRTNGIIYIENIIRGRYGPGTLEDLLMRTAEADGRRCSIGLEQEPGSAGKLFVATMVRRLAGWHIRGVRSTGDKITRAMPFFAQAEAGNIRLVRGAWNMDFLDEITAVPNARNDDHLDSASGGFTMLVRGGWSRGPAN